MATRISIKQLHQTTGELVRLAATSSSAIQVTDRGKPVAVLTRPALLLRKRRTRTLLPEYKALRRAGADAAGRGDVAALHPPTATLHAGHRECARRTRRNPPGAHSAVCAQLGRNLRVHPESSVQVGRGVDVHCHVDVAVGLCRSPCLRAEEISFQDFRPAGQHLGQLVHELRASSLHEFRMQDFPLASNWGLSSNLDWVRRPRFWLLPHEAAYTRLVVERIAKALHGTPVVAAYLFGSRQSGRALADSDTDIAVLLPRRAESSLLAIQYRIQRRRLAEEGTLGRPGLGGSKAHTA